MSYMKELRRLIRNRLHDTSKEKMFTKQMLNDFICIAECAVAAYTKSEEVKLSFHKDLVVNYVVVQCLGAKALIEKGREFSQSDNGITFVPPEMSAILQEQYRLEYEMFFRKIHILNNK